MDSILPQGKKLGKETLIGMGNPRSTLAMELQRRCELPLSHLQRSFGMGNPRSMLLRNCRDGASPSLALKKPKKSRATSTRKVRNDLHDSL